MRPTAGDRLGPYEIIGEIGAGGMGEVFRARDSRLHRDVAIKVLHQDAATDAQRVRRFEIEARAAGALNHPNILTLFDVGEHLGSPYVVTELLDGQDLRHRLQAGPMPVAEAVDMAAQTARGLAAAHDKGIVHRDLKPENLFVVSGGRVKILDFGIAKLIATDDGATQTAMPVTETGQTLGTAGYMAPEQVRGEDVSPATDLFALGTVLYEMLTGTRAFAGATRVDTLHAILRDEPAEIPASVGVPPAVDRILRRCLAKRPENRFHSAHDLAFALENLTAPASIIAQRSTTRSWQFARTAGLVAGGAIIAVAIATVWQKPERVAPTFTPVTARRQSVGFARFTPDPQTIVYDATQQEGAHELFSARVGSSDARAYGLQASVLAVSKSGELALLVKDPIGRARTLARLPLEGGSPREVAADVLGASWSPSGELAVHRVVNGVHRFEFPIGRVRAESAVGLGPFFSPSGDWLAFLMPDNSQPTLQLLDVSRSDPPRVVLHFKSAPSGVCWGANGNELFYMYADGLVSELRGVTTSGHDRLLLRLPGQYVLQDCRSDGAVLVERMNTSGEIAAITPESADPVDLSLLNDALVTDVSRDGRLILFAGGASGAYLRGTNVRQAPVKLGDGLPLNLSPDGLWALVEGSGEHVLLPTGAGQPRHLTSKPLIKAFPPEILRRSSFWMPDSKHIVFAASDGQTPNRCFMQSIDGDEPPRAITPTGVTFCTSPSPDGRRFFINRTTVFDLDRGEQRTLPGLTNAGEPVTWNDDGSAIFVTEAVSPSVSRIVRVDQPSGRRTAIRELRAAGPIGGAAGGIATVRMSADARTIAYTVNRYFSELMVIEGLK